MLNVYLYVCVPRHIAELIFYMEELRAHVRKYGPVMQRYYVQYLSGFDAVVLNELVQVRVLCPSSSRRTGARGKLVATAFKLAAYA